MNEPRFSVHYQDTFTVTRYREVMTETQVQELKSNQEYIVISAVPEENTRKKE